MLRAADANAAVGCVGNRRRLILAIAWLWQNAWRAVLLRQDPLRCSLCLFEKRSDRGQFVRGTHHRNCVLELLVDVLDDLLRRRRHAEYGQGVVRFVTHVRLLPVGRRRRWKKEQRGGPRRGERTGRLLVQAGWRRAGGSGSGAQSRELQAA
jgi:hypothetical protein